MSHRQDEVLSWWLSHTWHSNWIAKHTTQSSCGQWGIRSSVHCRNERSTKSWGWNTKEWTRVCLAIVQDTGPAGLVLLFLRSSRIAKLTLDYTPHTLRHFRRAWELIIPTVLFLLGSRVSQTLILHNIGSRRQYWHHVCIQISVQEISSTIKDVMREMICAVWPCSHRQHRQPWTRSYGTVKWSISTAIEKWLVPKISDVERACVMLLPK